MLLPTLVLTAAALATPTMSTDRECYAAGRDTIAITGTGFAPSAPVAINFTGNDEVLTSDATADANGALDTEVTAPDLKDFNADSSAIPVAVDTADGATAGFDLVEWDGTLTGYRSTIRRGQRLKFETTGWTGADTLYLHYVRGGKTVFTQRLGATSRPVRRPRQALQGVHLPRRQARQLQPADLAERGVHQHRPLVRLQAGALRLIS